MKFSLNCFFLISLLLFTSVSAATKRSFVVYLGAHSHGPNPSTSDFERASAYHHDFLGSFLGEKRRNTRDSIFYSYTKSINGFAAIMEEEHAARIAEHPDVVSVFPDEPLKLHTTHSWRFMGLEDEKQLLVPNGSLWTKARFGEGVIIGNIDTGVWPESMSFDDYGLGDIPAGKWKGRCDGDVKCNKKLIGARFYGKGSEQSGGGWVNSSKDYNTARDYHGHGTHTLATAGGSPVAGASIFGYAKGTARGGSPRARVAAYKACFDSGSCFPSDILASFDAAIHDGVDVLSVSLAGPNPPPYFRDSVAIGAFHAVRNNIVVVAAAGNYGSSPGSVSNPAPWVFTVAASTTDRKISSSLVLDDGKIFPGQSLSTATLSLALTYPIVDAVDAKLPEAFARDAETCFEESLDERKVRGKVVVCRWAHGVEVESGAEVRRAGGAGMVVLEAPFQEVNAEAHVLPATVISGKDGNALLRHMRAMKILNRTVRGTITRPVTVFGSGPAPVMAGFSSRGPNKVTPVILKVLDDDQNKPGSCTDLVLSRFIASKTELHHISNISSSSFTTSCKLLPPMANPWSFSLLVPSLQSLKLDGHNYPQWRNHLLSLFTAHDDDGDLLRHLDGSLPPPPDPDLFPRWFCTDQVLICLIHATLSEHILYAVVGSCSSSSRELWLALEKMFAPQARVSALHLQIQLQSMRKNGMSAEEYLGKMKSLSDALSGLVQKPVDDSDLVLFALTGLGPDYEPFVSMVSRRAEPPSFEELRRLLQCHESRLYPSSRF
ncbi:hypothetical protein H6P81_017050 [Aristolochia fimbriata]|uniref:Uncharacterized protein n=1 Tax=Aristolochia fimbriata TaxID=158543 RepID=A0AAV7E060_ARIFI|nr:hypothetical protein H6P81_017050 [Aristolochia fimbriata]